MMGTRQHAILNSALEMRRASIDNVSIRTGIQAKEEYDAWYIKYLKCEPSKFFPFIVLSLQEHSISHVGRIKMISGGDI